MSPVPSGGTGGVVTSREEEAALDRQKVFAEGSEFGAEFERLACLKIVHEAESLEEAAKIISARRKEKP